MAMITTKLMTQQQQQQQPTELNDGGHLMVILSGQSVHDVVNAHKAQLTSTHHC